MFHARKPMPSAEKLAAKQRDVIKKDKKVRENAPSKDLDRDLKQTMDASDPVAKY